MFLLVLLGSCLMLVCYLFVLLLGGSIVFICQLFLLLLLDSSIQHSTYSSSS
jgi:hypothetical protein